MVQHSDTHDPRHQRDHPPAAAEPPEADSALRQHYRTLEARFDQAARFYDAQYGSPTESGRGNPLLGWLRERHLAVLRGVLPEKAAVLDIGCGTGEEALAVVRAGHSVLGLDISPAMVRQAQTKAAVYQITRGAVFHALPAGRINELDERGPFDAAFASLGTLNTEPDLPGLARGLHALLSPGAPLVATVMSRRCLFEMLHNARRLKSGATMERPAAWHEGRAGTGGVVAPVRFYWPDEFAAPFAPYFDVEHVEAFPLWLPPVHLHELYAAHPGRYRRRLALDERMRTWPGFRAWGDHFLMILRHTTQPIPESENT